MLLSEVSNELWDMLSIQDGEKVLTLFTQYYGMQLLDEGFKQHCIEEGYLEEEEEEEEEDA